MIYVSAFFHALRVLRLHNDEQKSICFISNQIFDKVRWIR